MSVSVLVSIERASRFPDDVWFHGIYGAPGRVEERISYVASRMCSFCEDSVGERFVDTRDPLLYRCTCKHSFFSIGAKVDEGAYFDMVSDNHEEPACVAGTPYADSGTPVLMLIAEPQYTVYKFCGVFSVQHKAESHMRKIIDEKGVNPEVFYLVDARLDENEYCAMPCFESCVFENARVRKEFDVGEGS